MVIYPRCETLYPSRLFMAETLVPFVSLQVFLPVTHEAQVPLLHRAPAAGELCLAGEAPDVPGRLVVLSRLTEGVVEVRLPAEGAAQTSGRTHLVMGNRDDTFASTSGTTPLPL